MEPRNAQAAYLTPRPVAFGIDTPGLSIPLPVLLGNQVDWHRPENDVGNCFSSKNVFNSRLLFECLSNEAERISEFFCDPGDLR